MKRLLCKRGCLLPLALLAASQCWGQAGRGGIGGIVTDSSGAVVSGAAVVLADTATGVSQNMQTTASGIYSFKTLIPGDYTLTVTQSGFQQAVNKSIHVEVDHVTTVNVVLTPGATAEVVDVTEKSGTMLDTTESIVGQLIDNKTLESVPLNGRDAYLLVQLSPGVTPVNGELNQTGAWNRPGIGVSAFRINGIQEGTITYVEDGSPLTILGYGSASTSPALTPPLDSLQEFRLVTNNMNTSVASMGSGVISLVSKSGTNQPHGTAFYFDRPNALVANDPFNKQAELLAGQPNTPPAGYWRRQWGGSLGGPLRKDKLFFFGDYENTRVNKVATATMTVPTQAERTGDFSDVPTIYNPFNVNSSGQRQPFSGNVIDPSLLDPVALNMEKLIPLPNHPGIGPYHQNNYFDTGASPDNADKVDARIDYYLSNRHQVFGRYSYANMTVGTADHYHNGADPGYYLDYTRAQNALLAYTFTRSPNTVLQARYSFTRHREVQPSGVTNVSLTSLGFPAALASASTVSGLPAMFISGMQGVGSATWATGFKFAAMNHDAIVSIDTLHGRHDIKYGFEYRKDLQNMGQPIAPNGEYGFDTTATSSTTFAGDGYGYASFLLGMGTPGGESLAFTRDAFPKESDSYYGFFGEDTVRATEKLTLNFGLRWEIFGPAKERHDELEYFDPNATYALNGVSLRGGEVFAHGGKSPYTTNLRDFAPRFGVAYRPLTHLVMHGGGGIFYGPNPAAVGLPLANGDSFSSQSTWLSTTTDSFGNSVMLNPLHNPFPNGLVPLTRGADGLATNLGNVVEAVYRSEPTPAAYNWNGGLQYEFPHDVMVSATYVGSRGIHDILGNGASGPDLNQLSLQTIAQYNTRLYDQVPNPFLNAITNPTAPFYNQPTIPRWQALAAYPQYAACSGLPCRYFMGVQLNQLPLTSSIYHGFDVQVEKRLSSHFQAMVSFTAAKTISTGSNGAYSYVMQAAGYQDWRNLNLERALDPQDVSRSLSMAMFYDLPIGRGRLINTGSGWANYVVGGWTANTVVSFSTGVPIIVTSDFPNRSPFFDQRPDLTCDAAKGARHGADQWFLPNCFAVPASPFVAGTAPRVLPDVRADGVHNVDFSIFKNFPIGEHKNLQFRAEAFNLTNSVQLGKPNSFWNPVDLSTFGQITYASSTPREFQFGGRFTF